MIRADKEVLERDEIYAFLQKNKIIRIAFHTKTPPHAPYIVPLCYGFDYDNTSLVFYFHGATKGRKMELAKENPSVGFEIDTYIDTKTSKQACSFSIIYESMIGTGHLHIIEDVAEKVHCLNRIMFQFTGKEQWEYREEMLKKTTAFSLAVDSFTMKRNS
ncbi:MAG: pyridoxamine 5'-phosphate oxidase family protein [Methanomicrobiales archaeon]|nr:pyridoxamine 5'-phosphate oxidase family protein [Methanomicrobiales archaeon]